MKIRFKTLPYQEDAVKAVVKCFVDQPYSSGHKYTIDKGVVNQAQQSIQADMLEEALDLQRSNKKKALIADIGFENAKLFDLNVILQNIQRVQTLNGLESSVALATSDTKNGKNLTGSPLNLDIEMETGTGKTYCYIRTMYELYKTYGWSKFIIVVPTIAIREGVSKSFKLMEDHFQELYGKKARVFVYDSKNLEQLNSYSSDSGIQVMIINVQAFVSASKENRRIYGQQRIRNGIPVVDKDGNPVLEGLDDFNSRKPIDIIRKNRPILILDEPQKMKADNTLMSLSNFNPLFILRYSATHAVNYNKIYRLDAIDACNQKLVKKISVKSIEVNNLLGTHGYLYLQEIITSSAAPIAKLEIEYKLKNGDIKRKVITVKKTSNESNATNLYDASNYLDQYKDRYIIQNIDARDHSVTFLNGEKIYVGQYLGAYDETIMRTIQIRETIRSHFEKERQLFKQGIKTLSLFFIDEVAKYRQYDENNKAFDGEYAQIFREQYTALLNEMIALNVENAPYIEYLKSIDVNQTHNGYFSIDKKSKRLLDPKIDSKSEEKKISNDIDAYDLILKDKEALLALPKSDDSDKDKQKKNVRFIFSHSALREGWDNPNIFTICTLKHSDNTTSRRQEIGRGLRLAVNQKGERMDANYLGAVGEVHKINELTVVANESYASFVKGLQDEFEDILLNRPTQASIKFFIDKNLINLDGSITNISPEQAAEIYVYLKSNEYIDQNSHITPKYHQAKADEKLEKLPDSLEDYSSQIFKLVDAIINPEELNKNYSDKNKAVVNSINKSNRDKAEFQQLWQRINRKALYQVEIDTDQLITDAVSAIQREAKDRNNNFVESLTYKISQGSLKDDVTHEDIESKDAFKRLSTESEAVKITSQSQVPYDLVGKLAENTNLTRRTIATILADKKRGINAAIFAQFKLNPEAFIREMTRIINDQRSKMIVNKLQYIPLDEQHEIDDIFTEGETVSSTTFASNKHILERVVTESDTELRFAQDLQDAKEVIVYAKLPKKFKISTPFENYSPDWAIAFDKDRVREIYFVAETKGSNDENQLRGIEKAKTECAAKFFKTLNKENEELGHPVRYEVLKTYGDLLKLIGLQSKVY